MAGKEHRDLANMTEVMIRDYCETALQFTNRTTPFVELEKPKDGQQLG